MPPSFLSSSFCSVFLFFRSLPSFLLPLLTSKAFAEGGERGRDDERVRSRTRRGGRGEKPTFFVYETPSLAPFSGSEKKPQVEFVLQPFCFVEGEGGSSSRRNGC